MNKFKNYISLNLLSLFGWICILIWICIYLKYLVFGANYYVADKGDTIAWYILFGVFANSGILAFLILIVVIEHIVKESSSFPAKEKTKFEKFTSTKIYTALFFIGILLSLFPIIFILYVFLS
jgi:hypothetical protein